MNKSIKDPYYCDKEVKRFERFLFVNDMHLDMLDDNKIHYTVIRRLNSAGFSCKVYYNIAVNYTKLYKAIGLIDRVNEVQRGSTVAYFRID